MNLPLFYFLYIGVVIQFSKHITKRCVNVKIHPLGEPIKRSKSETGRILPLHKFESHAKGKPVFTYQCGLHVPV